MPTIREIAKALNMSRTTVSEALRNSSIVAAATRKRVQEKAKAMGYRTDPHLSQLMSYLSQKKPKKALCNVAWINTWGRVDIWNELWLKDYWRGAQSRAETLGFNLDPIWLGDPETSIKTLPRILKSRGIHGVILPLVQGDHLFSELPLENLAVTLIEEFQREFIFHRVSTHHLRNIQLALDQLEKMGYRRPGLCCSEYGNESSGRCYWETFFHAQKIRFKDRPVPILKDGDAAPVSKWVHKYRPDVVICNNADILRHVRAAGLKVPEDLSVIHLNRSHDTPTWAGVDANQFAIGVAAMNDLVGQINRNEQGAPEIPLEILIRGKWVNGSTCPPLKHKRSLKY